MKDKKEIIKTDNEQNDSVGKYFGTDGFRGEAGVTLTAEHAYRVGRFIGWYFAALHPQDRARIAVGKDTRLSGYMLEHSLIAGITASGADAYMLDVITTPAVAYVTRVSGFDCGIMITASHNPYGDNGIKLIDRDGEKMSDEVTHAVECYIDGDTYALGIKDDELPFATGSRMGKAVAYESGRSRYIRYLTALIPGHIDGMKIGLDCANGAASYIAGQVFSELGGNVTLSGCEPDGLNINLNVGSTNIENLVGLVRKNCLDVGFAFDGDGDRCIAVDSNGEIVDGDGIMYILAKRLKELGELSRPEIAVTVMSNAGLVEAFRKMGIGCEVTQVGDRFVYGRMRERGLTLGGEASGHIILRKYATTGDGMLTALIVADEMQRKGQSLSELTDGLKIYPQITKNLKGCNRDKILNDKTVMAEAERIRAELGEQGKLLIRKSGTEPLLRISVECADEEKCEEYIDRIINAIKAGGHKIGE